MTLQRLDETFAPYYTGPFGEWDRAYDLGGDETSAFPIDPVFLVVEIEDGRVVEAAILQ